VNVVRAGPGLGGILPSQGDYSQATGGVGHGDCNVLVLAPASLQETVDIVQEAFDLSQKYRSPVLVLVDGVIGQIMEAVEIKKKDDRFDSSPETWAMGYMKRRGGKRKVIHSLFLDPEKLEIHNHALEEKWRRIENSEARYETYNMDDAEVVITAFGTVARIAKSVVDILREEGRRVGLIRPISVRPFPMEPYRNLPPSAKAVLCVEMNWGQMIKDVRYALEGRLPVEFYGRSGGACPSQAEIKTRCLEILENPSK
jgi:2-oxoglutarate ferredoxin oxidoreductase subunit alpha